MARMSWSEAPVLTGRRRFDHRQLWIVGILFFGVGDLVTTSVGIGVAGVVEGNPVAEPLIRQYGVGALAGLKALTFAGCYLVWRLTVRPYNTGIPLGLAVLGVSVTAWNLFVLGYVVV